MSHYHGLTRISRHFNQEIAANCDKFIRTGVAWLSFCLILSPRWPGANEKGRNVLGNSLKHRGLVGMALTDASRAGLSPVSAWACNQALPIAARGVWGETPGAGISPPAETRKPRGGGPRLGGGGMNPTQRVATKHVATQAAATGSTCVARAEQRAR